MSKLAWYWHRLRAMSPVEVALHVRKKWRAASDAKRTAWPEVNLDSSAAFPKLPRPEDAPEVLRDALRRDVDNILAGRWKAFGHLELQVDDPPQWHKDYLIGKNFETNESAFKLNYRELADGADIKLIWELSRWYQLVRLAMAAYVLGDGRAAIKCVEWLEDWVKHNPPYCGWNWTSALEVGMRLVQFTWIDALIGATDSASALQSRLGALRRQILPPHVWYAWRHKSFGSSANNHLIGELAGLILATVRWPGLAQIGTSLDELQARWEREVLAQFAEDGGNKEQALNYHLFSWEFCCQVWMALAVGRKPNSASAVEYRLSQAARFFWEAQARKDHWDYGDSDNAFVTPFFANELSAVSEWRDWLASSPQSASIHYWLGASPWHHAPWQPNPLGKGPPLYADAVGKWWVYRHSGMAFSESGMWWLRWDLSPLGYLATAAHGHLDALHLSIWCKGVALIVDPGTGAYYGDQRLRNWLASRAAHNGPRSSQAEQPRRLGSFLWAAHHSIPTIDSNKGERGVVGVSRLPGILMRRRIVHLPKGAGWKVEDQCIGNDGRAMEFTTRWQFAPGSWVKRISDRKFSVHRADVAVVIEVDGNWAEVELIEPVQESGQSLLASATTRPLEGIVSPAFRKVCRAPYLKLLARPQGDKPCVFTTTFLASAHS